VLVAVHLPSEAGGEAEVPEDVVSAYEDGIMEPFFNACHIVCNSRDNGEGAPADNAPERNGIDYCVSVDLRFSFSGTGMGVLDSSYTLYRLSTGKAVISGGASSVDFQEPDTAGENTVYRMLGQAAAAEVLEAMKDRS